jgi:hypothetical protein
MGLVIAALTAAGPQTTTPCGDDEECAQKPATRVFATASGKKYHTKQCMAIQGRQASELTQKVAAEKGLSLCKICAKKSQTGAKMVTRK